MVETLVGIKVLRGWQREVGSEDTRLPASCGCCRALCGTNSVFSLRLVRSLVAVQQALVEGTDEQILASGEA